MGDPPPPRLPELPISISAQLNALQPLQYSHVHSRYFQLARTREIPPSPTLLVLWRDVNCPCAGHINCNIPYRVAYLHRVYRIQDVPQKHARALDHRRRGRSVAPLVILPPSG